MRYSVVTRRVGPEESVVWRNRYTVRTFHTMVAALLKRSMSPATTERAAYPSRLANIQRPRSCRAGICLNARTYANNRVPTQERSSDPASSRHAKKYAIPGPRSTPRFCNATRMRDTAAIPSRKLSPTHDRRFNFGGPRPPITSESPSSARTECQFLDRRSSWWSFDGC